MWADFPEVLESGQEAYSFQDGEEMFDGAFFEAMEARARFDRDEVGDVVAEQLGDGRLLDLGGGSGVYARAILERAPGSRGVVADLESVLPVTRDHIEKCSLTDRLETRPVDLTTVEDLGGRYDVILLASILHMFAPQTVQDILGCCAETLNPGGCVVIRDYVLEDNRQDPEDGVLFDLMMLLATEGGRSYTRSDFETFLEEAGFEPPRRVELSGVTDDLLVASPRS
jgi:cyclopropane fatty-acyl-phospholipid synthase-like methyltransferase